MPSFVTQALTFIQDVSKWIALLAIPGTGVFVAYHALAQGMSHDEMSAAQHSRALRKTLIYGAITVASGAIVSTVLGYFR